MFKHPLITQQRIGAALAEIREMIYSARVPLTVEAFHVGGEPIPAREAVKREFKPFAVGDAWGPGWDTTWFRFSGRIPDEWKGREVDALVDLGGKGGEGFTAEGLVWRDGKAERAINVHRADVPLTKRARGGEAFEFFVEAGANPGAQMSATVTIGGVVRQPMFKLLQAEAACFNREAFDFYHDFRTAYETLRALLGDAKEVTDPRTGQLLYALNAAVNLFRRDDPKTIGAARAALAEVLAKRNGDTAHRLSAIGHAHIDTAWLWPLRETIRKCARTFSTALKYMEEYPDYVFGCSQPQQYAWMKAYYPEIFEGIKAAVKRGQWEPIGSMWIEADCNLSSGEALVRQILHGKRFFLEEFGYETTEVWLPDVFGYSASMPQLLRKAGVRYFLTQKISWNQFNKFPHHTFLWEGIDGTRVFTHFPPADTYNAEFSPWQLLYNVRNFKEHDRATRSLYVYGHGDGGGGPTKEMLETAARVKDLEGLPKVTQEKVLDFFAEAEADARDLPLWVGELYLELHRGTYTTQAKNKKGNRKGELLLRDAEFFDSVRAASGMADVEGLAAAPARAVYDVSGADDATAAAYLDRAWKLLLLNQFHDIIPGSSITWVYEDSARDYAAIVELGGAVLAQARAATAAAIDTSGFAEPLIVFNTAAFAREEVVSLGDGSPAFVRAPACGYAVVEKGSASSLPDGMRPVSVSTGERICIENGLLRVTFDAEGCLESVFDLRAGREALAGRGNVLQLHDDRPVKWDAWDVDVFYRESVTDIVGVERVELMESSPLRGTVLVTRRFGEGSFVTQRITLRAGSARIDFETEVDWRESKKFLKAAFPVNVLAGRATYEIQFGHVERPTHYNTSWDLARFEVCAQRWADLSEGDYGVALLNDCKYGHDILGNVMRLSLLRVPTAPDPVADRGVHQFTYSLLPHQGDIRQGRVIEEAAALNVPLQIVPAAKHGGKLPGFGSFFEVDRPGVFIEAVKIAEDGGAVIVRLYEAYATRGPLRVKTSLPFKKAFLCDLLERTQEPVDLADGVVTLDVRPFEIVSLRFPIA